MTQSVMIVPFVIVRSRSRHSIGRKRREVVSAVMSAVTIIRVTTVIRIMVSSCVRRSGVFELCSSIGQHVETSIGAASKTPVIWIQIRLVVCSISRKGMWR